MVLIEINTSRFQLPPRPHQLQGLKTLLKKPFYGLFWEMRLQKTKVVIDTAITLFDNDLIDTVVVVAPSQVKDVWLEPEFGELKVHAPGFTSFEYSGRTEKYLERQPINLTFIVASLEFLRQESKEGRGRSYPKVQTLLKRLKEKRYYLVADEGSAFGSHKSNQWRATRELRKQAARFTMMDGTPVGNSPMEQYPKFKLIDPNIIGYNTFTAFKTAHAVLAGGRFPSIVGFKDQAIIDGRVKDHCEYLEQKDVTDMSFPEFVPSHLSVALKPKSWETYKSLRDDLYAQIDSGEIAVQHAPVAILRLAQVCAGFVGGVSNEFAPPVADSDIFKPQTIEIGDEATEMIMTWLKVRLHEDKNFKTVIWCRWRPEIERLHKRLNDLGVPNGLCYGGGKEDLEVLNRRSDYKGAFVMIAQPQAARYGKDWSKAATVVYLSQDYSRVTRSQSEQRVQAENTRESTVLIDVLVTGPEGQRTVTHDIVKSVRNKEEVARRTAREWKKALE